MLSCPALWIKFPFLMLFKIVQNSWRSTTLSQNLLFFGAIYGFIRASKDELTWAIPLIAIPFLVAWSGISIIAIRLKRYKIPFFWWTMMMAWPVLQFLIDFYTVFTWRK